MKSLLYNKCVPPYKLCHVISIIQFKSYLMVLTLADSEPHKTNIYTMYTVVLGPVLIIKTGFRGFETKSGISKVYRDMIKSLRKRT